MNLFRSTFRRLADALIARTTRRPPDFVIGGHDDPYLLRWYLTPWRGWYRRVPEKQRTRWQRFAVVIGRILPNIYLHQFRRSDDDRAHHDHPWLFNVSWLLRNTYTECTIAKGGVHRREVLTAGQIRFRWWAAPHRVELHDGWCWTLFITSPIVREWGFHCPERGWVHWKEFTAAGDAGAIGRGCGEMVAANDNDHATEASA